TPNGMSPPFEFLDRAFLPNAVKNGAALFERTRATEIRETPDGVEVVVRGPDGRRVLVTAELVPAPDYLDRSPPGPVAYTVTAVDRSRKRNESAPSAEVPAAP
ncbi:MAG: hypothetical protein AAB195_00545, partial [candidate division NC10 bacterium]